ncbi:MAG: 4-alpha-glucanotransferase [Bacilli bacterium]
MKKSGVLLPISALPSKYYIGSFGAEALDFATKLQEAKQSYWQVLPLSYPDSYHSPYASLATKAGDPLLIDLELLVKQGLLKAKDLPNTSYGKQVAYRKAKVLKTNLLKKAYVAFKPNNDYRDFIQANPWVKDFATFITLHEHYHKKWSAWPSKYKYRDSQALLEFQKNNQEKINYQIFVQYIFNTQLVEFKQALNKKGIKLIGDVPMYVSYDSFDVWANPKSFRLDEKLEPIAVSGVGPDYFSKEGQLWGQPLYNFKNERQNNYPYFQDKMHYLASKYDVVRLDHFRAFDSYYVIPKGATTALNGKWVKGEGYPLINALFTSAPNLDFIGEDLGDIPASVSILLKRSKIPGMKVLQFAFDGNPNNPFLPNNIQENCVAYLGTHDNDTTSHWYRSLDAHTQELVQSVAKAKKPKLVTRNLLQVLALTKANLVIYNLADLAITSRPKRINTPGTIHGNWIYMLRKNDSDFAYLKKITLLSKRG